MNQLCIIWGYQEELSSTAAGPHAEYIARSTCPPRTFNDPDTLQKLADGLGMDGEGLLASAGTGSAIPEFDRYTQAAQDRGAFGSPFYFLGEEVFWGQDRLQFLEDALARSTKQGTLPRLIPPTQ
jgi:hypothetical protein